MLVGDANFLIKIIIGVMTFTALFMYDYFNINVKYLVYSLVFLVFFAIAAWIDSAFRREMDEDE